MADNKLLPASGSGSTITCATDEIAGVDYQLIKLVDGTADSTTVVKAGGGVEANALRVTIASDSTGVVSIDDNGGSLTVDGSVSLAAALPAGTNNIGDVDVLSVPADPFGANADAASATGSISAKLRFIAATGIPITGTVTVGSHAVTNAGTFAVQAASAGDVAHDAADSGNPVKVGAQARTTNPTAVADADRVNLTADDLGRQVVVLNQVRDLVGSQVTTITNSTSETTIVTAVASTFCDLTHLTITNASATAVTATLKDSTGGTTRGIYALAANGGIVLTFPVPKKQATVNNNWTITLSGNTVTVYIVAEFVQNI